MVSLRRGISLRITVLFFLSLFLDFFSPCVLSLFSFIAISSTMSSVPSSSVISLDPFELLAACRLLSIPVVLYRSLSCRFLPFPAVPRRFILFPAVLYRSLSFPDILRRSLPFPDVLRRSLPFPDVLRRSLPFHILSFTYPVLSIVFPCHSLFSSCRYLLLPAVPYCYLLVRSVLPGYIKLPYAIPRHPVPRKTVHLTLFDAGSHSSLPSLVSILRPSVDVPLSSLLAALCCPLTPL